MNTTQFNPTPEELNDAEESARLVDDVLAGRKTQSIHPQDLHTAHLLRTLDSNSTTPSAAFTERVRTSSQMLFPRQVSWFYRFRFILVGIPVVGSMAIAAFAFTRSAPNEPASTPIARTATLNINSAAANTNTESANTTEETTNEENINTNTAQINQNINTTSTQHVVNTATSAAELASIAADLAALNALEAELNTTLDTIDGLIADSNALDSSDTVSADITSLSQELSTL